MLEKVIHSFDQPNNSHRIVSPENSNHNSISNSFPQPENATSNPEHIATSGQAESMIWRGIKLEKDNFAAAIECYRQAVELSSQSAIAHRVLAMALKKQNKLTAANFHYQQALSLEKNQQKSDLNHSPQADSQVQNLNQPESKQAVVLPQLTTTALGKYVENTELEVAKIFLQQAKLYFAERHWQEAINACKDAIEVCPDIAETYKVYGNSLQKLGRTAEAIGFYAKALAIDPNFAEVYANIGNTYAQQEQWQEAVDYYQKALKLNPKLARIYIHLSRVWEKQGESERALNCLIEGLECEPEIFTLEQYLQLADELLKEGKIDSAITCCEYAVKLYPHSKIAYQKIIKALEQNGEWKKAASYYQDILKISEDSTEENNHSKQVEKKQIERLLKNSSNNITEHQVSSNKNQNISLSTISTATENQQQIDLAISHFITKLQHEPKSSDIRLKLGNLFAQKQKWKQAILCYQQAIKLEPNSAIAYIKLGKIYGILGENIKGAKLVLQGYSLRPEAVSAEEHYKLGNYFIQHQEPQLGISCFRRAIELKPDFSAAHHKLQNLMDVQTNKQRLIEPDSSHNSESILSLQPSKEQSAVTNKQTETNSTVDNAKLFFEMGIAAEQEDWNLAYEYYLKAIEQEPTNWLAYHQAGTVLKNQHQWSKATKYYLKAIKLNQQDFTLYHNLGETYLELFQWHDAVDAFQQSISLNPNFSWSHYKLGLALIELKLWQEAADAINSSVKLNPNFDWAYHKLGDIYTHQKNWDKGVAAFQNALKLTPDLPKTKEKLIEVLRQRSQADRQQVEAFYADAVNIEPDKESSYFKALEIKPDCPKHYIQLAQIYEAKGQKNVAISFYRIALQINPHDSHVQAKLTALQS